MLLNVSSFKTVRIPVRLVDGYLELWAGGAVPIENGARFTMSIAQDRITDPYFLDIMTRRRSFRALPEGTRLIACVGANSTEPPIRFPDGSVLDYRAVKIQQQLSRRREIVMPTLVGLEIGPLPGGDTGQLFPESGGLWLKTEGLSATGLEASSVLLPEHFSSRPVKTLNHALTILSEELESDRISHTGNAYEQIYYQEANGYWYPLNWLRDDALHETEHEIARELWSKFQAEANLLTKSIQQ